MSFYSVAAPNYSHLNQTTAICTMVTTKPNQPKLNFENYKYHIIITRMHEKVKVQSCSKYLMPAGDRLTPLYQNLFLMSQVIIRFQCVSFAIKSHTQETCFVPYSRLRCSKVTLMTKKKFPRRLPSYPLYFHLHHHH